VVGVAIERIVIGLLFKIISDLSQVLHHVIEPILKLFLQLLGNRTLGNMIGIYLQVLVDSNALLK
jgi:hypothetical protein